MSERSEWTWHTSGGVTHIIRPSNPQTVEAVREKVRRGCAAYRLGCDHTYVVSEVPSTGEAIDLVTADLERATRSPRTGNPASWLARRVLAGMALLALLVLPTGLAGLVAIGYAAAVASRSPLTVTDLDSGPVDPYPDNSFEGWS